MRLRSRPLKHSDFGPNFRSHVRSRRRIPLRMTTISWRCARGMSHPRAADSGSACRSWMATRQRTRCVRWAKRPAYRPAKGQVSCQLAERQLSSLFSYSIYNMSPQFCQPKDVPRAFKILFHLKLLPLCNIVQQIL